MIVITVYALTMPPSPMFRREFERPIEANDYASFWRQLGCCHVKRTKT
jgi:hypothetical protein